MESNEFLMIETQIIDVLKGIFDPEIPVNIYELGLIYKVDVDDNQFVTIVMTLTAPNCPVADSLPLDVRNRVAAIPGVSGVYVDLSFEPPWDKDMMSDEAKLELGFL
ncbi:MAG: SUF system Fe-S cluster assembly protein [Bacteroidales bacterium]|nr:SUF system Fe-S cluster assembly protein [Bacteroidales bacterium]